VLKRLGVEGLISEVRGVGSRSGKAENLEKGRCRKKIEEKPKAPHAKTAYGAPQSGRVAASGPPALSLRRRSGVRSALLWRSIPKGHHRCRWIRTSLLLRKKWWTLLKKRPWNLSLRVTRPPGTQVAQGSERSLDSRRSLGIRILVGCSAFLRSRRVKCSPLLFHFRATTLRTLHFVLIVFSNR
jgi:hypothetical protein